MTERQADDVHAELLEEARQQTKELAAIKFAVVLLTFVFLLLVLLGVVIGTR